MADSTKDRLLSRNEAARQLDLKPQTLATWAMTSRHLPFVKPRPDGAVSRERRAAPRSRGQLHRARPEYTSPNGAYDGTRKFIHPANPPGAPSRRGEFRNARSPCKAGVFAKNGELQNGLERK